MAPDPRSLRSRFFARFKPRSAELVDYLEWSRGNEHDPALSAEQQAHLARLAEGNELCRREQALLDELAAKEESSAVNLATVEATLKRLRAQNNVVALRPGTAPPAASSPLPQRSGITPQGALSFALVGAVLLIGLAFWGLNSEVPAPFAAAPSVKKDVPALGIPTEDTATTSDSAATLSAATSSDAAARLALFSGNVHVDGQPQLIAGQELRAGSVVTVLSGRACLSFPRAIAACLEQGSEIVVPAPAAELSLEVRRGRVAAQLSKQAPGYSFSLFAGDTRALAVGTLFGLHARGNGEVSVQVVEGRVQVVLDAAKAAANRHELGAGQNIDSKVAQIQSSPKSSDAPYLALLAGQNLWSAAASSCTRSAAQCHAVLYVESEPPGALVHYDAKELGVTPLSVLLPQVDTAAQPAGAEPFEHLVALQLAGHESSERRFSTDSAGVHRLFFQLESSTAPSPSLARASAAASVDAVPTADASGLLSRARQLVREGRWLEASNTYRALRAAYPSSAEAKTVLVALGQLELDRLAQPRAAQSSFQGYLDSGGGALSQEARAGKIRALRAQGQRAAELAAIREYLALHPAGLDAATLGRRARELD